METPKFEIEIERTRKGDATFRLSMDFGAGKRWSFVCPIDDPDLRERLESVTPSEVTLDPDRLATRTTLALRAVPH